MRPFIPRPLEHIAFGLLLSCFMSLLISGVSTFLAAGMGPGFVGNWLSAWLSSWAIAFPSVLVVAPFVRRVLHKMVV
ncbi:DUF2798 domain-containing protein [Rhodobacteraceae bacterium N5(2021)]|uniref:DUF2798 domain-containing protein n=1 Tax=Gymnodinialimonas phycosphaerae TaxID=2841589 RepID=A0A975TYT6_9RHOB|nr:DUF2798 domain-containing protein [Gymnodinialimonas phycosphaerae]MBY4893013.1 DUF2798 domain-containing protein [Gymnodinialimonas phycosphaerae]